MSDDEIDELMREHGMRAIVARDFRIRNGQQMTHSESESYTALLNFARAVARAAASLGKDAG